MTTITAKVADLNAAIANIEANIYTVKGEAEAAKVRKMAKKMDVSFEDALQAMLVTKIKFGAIKMDGMWYPVVDSEIHPYSHTFSTGAMADCQHIAGQMGIVVKA